MFFLRLYQVKWFSSFKLPKTVLKQSMEHRLIKNDHRTTKLEEIKDQKLFLVQKAGTIALIATVKT